MKADSRLMRTNAYLKEKMLQWLPQHNRISTAIDGLMLSRCDKVSNGERCFYQPMVAIVVQGFKRSMLANQEYNYGDKHCMVVGVDMPGVYHIAKASPEEPFLSLSIKLDRYIISQLLSEMPPVSGKINESLSPVSVSEVTNEVLDACLRLVELLDNPAKIPVLAPMIIREIHFHLLSGVQGDCLRMVNTSGTKANHIAQAINWLRDNYAAPLDVDSLAKQVNMSSSTFHRHFRQVTTFSPLQFQKNLRLHEAERLMLLEGKDTRTAAFEVGYESTTQFNREYKRQFGESPHRDVTKKREIGLPQVE